MPIEMRYESAGAPGGPLDAARSYGRRQSQQEDIANAQKWYGLQTQRQGMQASAVNQGAAINQRGRAMEMQQQEAEAARNFQASQFDERADIAERQQGTQMAHQLEMEELRGVQRSEESRKAFRRQSFLLKTNARISQEDKMAIMAAEATIKAAQASDKLTGGQTEFIVNAQNKIIAQRSGGGDGTMPPTMAERHANASTTLDDGTIVTQKANGDYHYQMPPKREADPRVAQRQQDDKDARKMALDATRDQFPSGPMTTPPTAQQFHDAYAENLKKFRTLFNPPEVDPHDPTHAETKAQIEAQGAGVDPVEAAPDHRMSRAMEAMDEAGQTTGRGGDIWSAPQAPDDPKFVAHGEAMAQNPDFMLPMSATAGDVPFAPTPEVTGQIESLKASILEQQQAGDHEAMRGTVDELAALEKKHGIRGPEGWRDRLLHGEAAHPLLFGIGSSLSTGGQSDPSLARRAVSPHNARMLDNTPAGRSANREFGARILTHAQAIEAQDGRIMSREEHGQQQGLSGPKADLEYSRYRTIMSRMDGFTGDDKRWALMFPDMFATSADGMSADDKANLEEDWEERTLAVKTRWEGLMTDLEEATTDAAKDKAQLGLYEIMQQHSAVFGETKGRGEAAAPRPAAGFDTMSGMGGGVQFGTRPTPLARPADAAPGVPKQRRGRESATATETPGRTAKSGRPRLPDRQRVQPSMDDFMRVTDPRSREATEAPTARDEPELSREDLSKKLMWWQDKIDKILSGQDIRMDENVATLIGPHPEDQLGEVKEVLPWDAVMRRISRREALSRMNEEVERLWKLVYAEEWSQETPAPPAARGRTGQRPTPSGQ